MSKRFVAEFLGTAILVLFGCGAAVIAGADGTSGIGLTGIALAFGLASGRSRARISTPLYRWA